MSIRISNKPQGALLVALLACAISAGVRARPALAQQEPFLRDPSDRGGPESGAEAPVKVTSFIFTDSEIDASVATELVAGLRRGIREDPRLSWLDATEPLSEDGPAREEHTAAIAKLMARAVAAAEEEQWRGVTKVLDDALSEMSNGLQFARRRDIADASMLWAAAQCELGRRRACESAFRRVLVFREGVAYDTPGLPPRPEEVFEAVREETLERQRGSILINTSPLGAEVFVDGRFVGASPARAEGLLGGEHYVTAKLPGYGRAVERIDVSTDLEDTAFMELVEVNRAPLLRDALSSAESEMGGARVGTGMRELWSLLFMDQLILGHLERQGDDDTFALTLYLYDMRTNHGLRRVERTFDWTVTDLSIPEQLVEELYRGVDLQGRIRPREVGGPVGPRVPDPFYRTWWFWSIVGAAIVGTTVGISSAILPREEGGATLRLHF